MSYLPWNKKSGFSQQAHGQLFVIQNLMSIIHTNTIIITPPHVTMSINITWENYFLHQMMYVSLNNTTTDVTYGAGDANTSGTPEFTTGFSGFCVLCFVDRCLSFFDLLIQTSFCIFKPFFIHSFIHSNPVFTHKTGNWYNYMA